MTTSNVFSPEEIFTLFNKPALWKCNCMAPRYHRLLGNSNSYSPIICQCGHELNRYEYDTYEAKWRARMSIQDFKDEAKWRASTPIQDSKDTVSGQKFDTDKPRMELLLDFSRSLHQIAQLCTVGAEKYTAHGWIEVPDGENRYTAALLRHLITEEEMDEETGVLHDVAVAWNALTRLELKLRRLETADAS